MTYLVAAWVFLALIIAALALYRKSIANKEDVAIHLTSGESTAYEQTMVATKLASIDRWGKLLTVVEVLFGLGLLGFWMYLVWLKSSELQ